MKRILLAGPEVREVLETGRVVVRRAAPIADIHFTEQKDGFISWSVIFSKPLTSRKILSTHGGTYIDEEQARHYIGSQWNPLGAPGDKVWVGETFCIVDDSDFGEAIWIDYRATPRYSSQHPAGWENEPDNPEALKWRASTSMPQEHSRLTLEIVSVKVERGDKWEWVYDMNQVQP